ncbi:hypothetical protein HII31_01336 [Pseudocercospora fuligena]|uniref:Uncharacterized protein n=1 Tax=Pseudocercospora fuligena TaxID=685502 RepID=A0A8H6RWK0_9PEZI|nr:hypothetical protein HII31_01336 [Pseudocercospora fuligena]
MRGISLYVWYLPAVAWAAVPTITFGPSSNYQKPPAETAIPTGSDLIITPKDLSEGVPANGLDIFLGPDLIGNLSETLGGVCAKGLTQDCANALSNELNPHRALEARAVGFAFAPVAVGLAYFIAIWLRLTRTDQLKQIGPHFHLPATDIAQLQSQTASSLVFATSQNAPVVTITPTPSTTLENTPASLTTLTADQGLHHKGDVIISLPTQPANLLKQLIELQSQCTKQQPNRRQSSGGSGLNIAVVTDVAIWVLPNAAPHQLLNGFNLQMIPQHLLHFRDEATQKALETVQAAALKLPEYAGIAADLTKGIATYVFTAAYGLCIEHAAELEQIAIESSLITDDPADDDDTEKNCNKDVQSAASCDEPTCLGQNGQCQHDDQRGCFCLQKMRLYSQPGNRSDWDAAQKVIKYMFEGGKEKPGKLECDSNKRINLESSDFKKFSSAFCKGTDLDKDISRSISPQEAGTRGAYTGFSFNFSWKRKDATCTMPCNTIFEAFTGSTVCSYDSHTFAASGSQELTCGTASFRFNDGQSDSVEDLSCGLQTDMGNANHFASLDTMNQAVDYYCQKQADLKTHFEPGKVADDSKNKTWHYNDYRYDPIYLSMDWHDSSNCPSIDFSTTDGTDTCKDRLKFIINTCDTANPKGLHYWKQGGVYTRNCIQWTIRRDKFTSSQPSNDDSWRPPATCQKDADCDEGCKASGKKGFCSQSWTSWVGWCSCTRSS